MISPYFGPKTNNCFYILSDHHNSARSSIIFRQSEFWETGPTSTFRNVRILGFGQPNLLIKIFGPARERERERVTKKNENILEQLQQEQQWIVVDGGDKRMSSNRSLEEKWLSNSIRRRTQNECWQTLQSWVSRLKLKRMIVNSYFRLLGRDGGCAMVIIPSGHHADVLSLNPTGASTCFCCTKASICPYSNHTPYSCYSTYFLKGMMSIRMNFIWINLSSAQVHNLEYFEQCDQIG